MWAFKTLWDKGLIYEGFRVLAYCWRCETPLSNTETRMDDVYRDRQDPALTVWFELEGGDRVLTWTTTPWTLPSNLALAVGPDIDYAVMEEDGQRYILAEARLDVYANELAGAERVGTVKGSELVGRRYRPLFDFLADTPNAFQVLAGDFVSTEEGTGIVHMAPGFGEDDQIACNAVGIPTICPMDEHGRFTAPVMDWIGQHVFDANADVIRRLKLDGVVVRHDSYNHSYPHCWRCDQPLVYRAISSWFVEVTAFRDRMVELNEQIRWVPEHVKDGSFGKWIANARDWSISRNRFWGSPIPVWVSDSPEYPRTDVYGSLAELEADFGVDGHRSPPARRSTNWCDSTPTTRPADRRCAASRQVLDCWFESGSMPFAQVHYPFENAEWFEHHYPGDFIVEYIAQTRGWFYTLHVLATALFDRPAFSTCVSHGIVLGDDGLKMSKSLRNYPDPMVMFEAYGADAMRWNLLSSPILRGGDFAVTENGMRDTVRHVIRPIWNAWYFLTLYANAAGTTGTFRTDQTDVLDRYLLGELRTLVRSMTSTMDDYDLFGACQNVVEFVETLTNWYIRRSRDRFWAGDQDAIDTLHTALVTLCRVAAPLLPMVTEHLYVGLTGERSVHLTDWPDAEQFPHDDDLTIGMGQVRDVCSTLLSLRKSEGLRVRLPLAKATVATPTTELMRPHLGILRDELNVKEIELTDDVQSVGRVELNLNPARLGPRLGGETQQVIKAHKAGDWSIDGDRVVVGGVELQPDEYTFRLVSSSDGVAATLPGNNGIVVLDTVVTDALEEEGLARDLIRAVQQARRSAGLDVSDRISLAVEAPVAVVDAFEAHRELVMGETLATSATAVEGAGSEPVITVARV